MKNTPPRIFLSCILSFIFFFSIVNAAISQHLVNREWQSAFGLPSDIDWSATAVSQNGDIISVGNTMVSAKRIDLLVTKHDNQGNILWQQQFNAPNQGEAYGVALVLDTASNIYVAGAVKAANSSTGFDFVVIKYDSLGTLLWNTIYNNGTGSKEDIPTAMLLTSGGDIYITGLSYDATAFSDYLTLKINASGVVQWQKIYDYNNLHDVPVAIAAATNGVVVTGGSASSASNWDYAAIMYDGSGNKLEEARLTSVGNSFDEPTSLKTDDQGNFYITGVASSNGINYDIRTLKLDSDLNLIWEKFYDGYGLADRANDLEVAYDGSVYVGGYTQNTNNQTEYVLLKYSSQGVLQWEHKWKSEDPKISATGEEIILNSDGMVIITGEVLEGSDSYLYTLAYDEDGKKLWENIGAKESGRDRPISMVTDDDNNIFINAYTAINGESKYRTSKLTYYFRNVDYVYENGKPSHTRKEIIIRFNDQVIDRSFTSSRNLVFGRVDRVVRDTTLLTILDQKLAKGGTTRGWTLVKIYTDYTPADSVLNCGGKEIKVPKIWNSFLLIAQGKVFDEKVASACLDSVSGNYIHFAEPNWLGEKYCDPALDGIEAGEQHSLCDLGSFNNADIDMTGAWAHVSGSSGVNVAIFDSGIMYRHEDFGYPGGDHGGIGGSVVKKLWNCDVSPPVALDENTPIDELTYNSHGTACAGIVGAIRHNDKGVAGIAGGNSGQDGVSLQGYLTGPAPQVASTARAYEKALGRIDGCPAQGVDIVNISYGFSGGASIKDLRSIYEFAYKAGLITVVAKGNSGNNNNVIPATYRDDRIISVGASGNDGNYKNASNGNPNDPNDNYDTNFGSGMDLVAPGASDIVKSLGIDPGGQEYIPFSGTSSAAPHTAGVAALLLQHHQDQYGSRLSIEDVEHILQYGAVDLDDGGTNTGTGYDDQSGWGRLNAGNSLDLISGCNKVVHVTADAGNFEVVDCNDPSNDCTFSLALESECLLDNCHGILPFDPSVPSQNLLAAEYRRHKVFIELDLSSYNGAEMVLFDNQPAAWVRNSSSNLWGRYFDNGPEFIAPLDAVKWLGTPTFENGVFRAVLEGYSYEVLSLSEPKVIPDVSGEQFQIAFSLLVCGDVPNEIEIEATPLHVQEFDKDVLSNFNISPNPTNERVNIEFDIPEPVRGNICISNINGRQIEILPLENLMNGSNSKNLLVRNLPPGIYFITLQTETSIQTKKLIKF